MAVEIKDVRRYSLNLRKEDGNACWPGSVSVRLSGTKEFQKR
ncbi:MAG: hypothetical protein ACTSXC_06675 [Candidatus Freyarchaeota archaeon]